MKTVRERSTPTKTREYTQLSCNNTLVIRQENKWIKNKKPSRIEKTVLKKRQQIKSKQNKQKRSRVFVLKMKHQTKQMLKRSLFIKCVFILKKEKKTRG